MRRLYLVGAPPACGKTTAAKLLAGLLNNPVYLDKDTLIPLSKKVFSAANEPYNRDSIFFKEHLRDAEYIAILDVAFENLKYNENVVVNAPFGKEFRDPRIMNKLKERAAACNAEIIPIWVKCSPDLSHQRMINRNSKRDWWKLENWEEYLKTQDYSIPDIHNLFVIDGTTFDTNKDSVKRLIHNLFG